MAESQRTKFEASSDKQRSKFEGRNEEREKFQNSNFRRAVVSNFVLHSRLRVLSFEFPVIHRGLGPFGRRIPLKPEHFQIEHRCTTIPFTSTTTSGNRSIDANESFRGAYPANPT